MKIQVIVGSIRPTRVSDRAAKWVAAAGAKLADTQAEVVDLIDYPMPLFDEAISPRYNPERKPEGEVKRWLDKVAEADAYVLVTPEYNRSTSPVLKNAIDYLDYQFEKKPVLLVGHGSSGGGAAISHLRGILPGVGAVTVPQAIYMTDRPGEVIDEEGNLSNELQQKPYGPQANLQTALELLKWYSDALASARAKA